ncbi:MAG: alpha/beta hydrolase family protein [Dehalococcoidia bacterium]
MSTFVLVHGAFGGAHGWHRVRPLLAEHGHAVFTPSLTGIGERAHLTSPQITLSTHIQDVVNCVEYEDLTDIVLVGFSYGGMVISGCADLIEDRIAHIVYLDAALPKDGESARAAGGAEAPPLAYRMGQEWLVKGPARVYDDPAEAAWAGPRRSDHPLGCFIEPVRLAKPIEEYDFTRTYIKATADRPPEDEPLPALWRNAEHTRRHPAWRYYEIDTTHMVPNNRPAELVEILRDVIAEESADEIT